MAIPKFKKEHIIEALKYIDENGVPFHNQSTKYELVTDDGRRYPPKYVVAVADHLANCVDISTDGYNAVEAKSYVCLFHLHGNDAGGADVHPIPDPHLLPGTAVYRVRHRSGQGESEYQYACPDQHRCPDRLPVRAPA